MSGYEQTGECKSHGRAECPLCGGLVEVVPVFEAGRLNATEAIMAFCSWLTTRPEEITMGADHSAIAVSDLVQRFIGTNDLPPPRADYHDHFIFPMGTDEERIDEVES